MTPHLFSTILPIVIIALVLFLRFRSIGKPTPLRLGLLWILPAFYALLAAGLFISLPPHGLGWLYAALALLLGGALGWQRGRLMQISVDPVTRKLTQTVSPAAMIFIVVLLVLRFGSRSIFGGVASGAGGLHGAALIVTDCLVAMALGFLVMQRVEIFLRAKRLLAALPATPPVSDGR